MMATDAFNQPSHRPYRSHKVPACHACRRRKIRCQFDGGQARSCQYCLTRGLECSWPSKARFMASQHPPAVIPPANAAQLDTEEQCSPLIVNRAMAEDVQILERYLASPAIPAFAKSSPYIQVSNTHGEPIVYHNVPRQRKGLLLSTQSPGVKQREIIEQILGPSKEDVVDLYFNKIHPCFPILDEASFKDMWEKNPERISHTLMCDIYAISLVFWNTSDQLRSQRRPDNSFVWNQAVIALRDDFMLPGMTTIHAALLDLLGRPVGWVAGNIINLGRTVTLAYSLGLHRNSSQWQISEQEKNLRTRMWYGVLIHDYWSSLSHGTPPTISPQNYDVPLPSMTVLGNNGSSESGNRSLTSFVHLCSLTEILGEILMLIYALRRNIDETWKNIRRIECALDQWEDTLPLYLNYFEQPEGGDLLRPNGASGIWFYFLSLKLILHRVALKTTLESKIPAQAEAESYRRALLRDAASAVIEYTLSLQDSQLQEFWLPYTSHLLVSAATILMRCAVESKTEDEKGVSISKLVRLMDHLRNARRTANWDLADFCIERCGKSIESMAAAQETSQQYDAPESDSWDQTAHDFESYETTQPDEFPMVLPYNAFDAENYIDHLWDPFWQNLESVL